MVAQLFATAKTSLHPPATRQLALHLLTAPGLSRVAGHQQPRTILPGREPALRCNEWQRGRGPAFGTRRVVRAAQRNLQLGLRTDCDSLGFPTNAFPPVGILLAMNRTARLCAPFLCILLPFAAADWPQWRGPERDGISNEADLLTTWPAQRFRNAVGREPGSDWGTSELGAGRAGRADSQPDEGLGGARSRPRKTPLRSAAARRRGGSAGWQGERKPPARYGEGPEPYGQAAA